MSKHARKHENASVSLKQKQTKKLCLDLKKVGWLLLLLLLFLLALAVWAVIKETPPII